MKASPLKLVQERFGSKEALIEKIAGTVEPLADESADEHKRRLKNVSNRKLLHLVTLTERVEALGGREGLVKRILELKGQSKDYEFETKLKSMSVGRLVDMVKSLEHRAAGKAKKRPKHLRAR